MLGGDAMDQTHGVVEEIISRLQAIHGTLERIEHLIARSAEDARRHFDVTSGRDAPDKAQHPTPKLQRSGAQLLTVGEVAAILGQSVATIRKWGYLRQIELVRIGRSVRISAAEVERLIRTHRQPARTT
jgi:excisionase family DNA binding protein